MLEKISQFKKKSAKWKLLVATDIVTVTFFDNKLQVLLVKRKYDPGKGSWAIPGGFVRENEDLQQAALRELKEETGLSEQVYLEQLYTFGEVDRDPRDRVISVAYLVLISKPQKLKLKATDDALQAKWFNFKKLPVLSFGKAHKKILKYALLRLRWKFEYTNVCFSLLPQEFTLGELQKLYEIVYQQKMDKRNFRKKILSLDLVLPLKKYKKERGRPALLYRSKTSKLKIYAKII